MTTATRPAPSSRRGRPPSIDPRIRERRIEVRRIAGRRRLRRLLVLGAVVAVAVGLVALTRSPLLAVRHLRVEGATQTSSAAVVAASGIRTGTPLLDVSTGGARRSIAQLPWVASVHVTRSFPNTVVLRVTERVPAAVVSDGAGGWLEVDTSGRVLARVTAPPAGLVAVTGLHQALEPGGQLAAPAGLLALAAAVPAPLRAAVASVEMGPGGLQLQLRGGGVAHLGDTSDLTAKLVSVQAVLTSQGVDPSCVGALDVSVAAAPALTPRPGCA